MLSKNRIKYIRSLHSKKNRWAEGLFLAEGTKLAEELFRSGLVITEVIAIQPWLDTHTVPAGIQVSSASLADLEQISALTTAQEVVLVIKIPEQKAVSPQENELMLVLDDVKDPGNLGTIIRIADWFGIRNIVCSESSVEVYNPKVVQATMGSISRVSVSYTALKPFLEDASAKNIPVHGAVLGGRNIYKEKLEDKGIILMGNESSGISAELLPFIKIPLTIPSFNSGAESLNVAVAAAMICYEFRRGEG